MKVEQNEIVSVVSRQDEYESQTEDNFTRIEQTNRYRSPRRWWYEPDKNADSEDGLTTSGDTNDQRPVLDWHLSPLLLVPSRLYVDLQRVLDFTQRVTVNPGGHYVISFYAKKKHPGWLKLPLLTIPTLWSLIRRCTVRLEEVPH